VKTLIKLAALTAALTGASAAYAGPDPSQVYIENFTHNGAGCAPGTTALNISPDRLAMTVIFDSYFVEGGTQSAARREEVLTPCLMNIRMHVPAGWQFAIHQVTYRGFASLDANTWGRQSSTYKWAAMPDFEPLAFMRFIGPYNGDYVNTSPAQGIRFSQCRPRVPSSQVLTIRSHVGVKGVRGYMTVDSFDHEIKEQYHITWRPC
jgi:hypothetical protein